MKKIVNLIFCLLFYPICLIGQSEKKGSIEINFPNFVHGYITLVTQVLKEDKLIKVTIDSSKLKDGKYVYRYNSIDATPVIVLFYPDDSEKKAIRIYAKNSYLNGYSDAVILDSHHAVIKIDSLFFQKNGIKCYRGNISGSPETDMNHKILNDWFNPTNGHKFTNQNGIIVNFSIIKDNPNSEILLHNIYNEREYYPLDSLETAFSIFNNIVKKTSIGIKVKTYIQQQKLFAKKGIANNFTFYDSQSKKYTFKECLEGKSIALIIFWASWCGPCIREIPHLKSLHNQFKNRIAFISISIDSDKKNWNKALKENPVDWLSLAGFSESSTKVLDIFGISSVPSFLVVDESGNVLLNGLKGFATNPIKGSVIEVITLNNIDLYLNEVSKIESKKFTLK